MPDIGKRVQYIAKELGVTAKSLDKRSLLFGLGESDREILNAYSEWTEQNVDALSESLLAFLESEDLHREGVALPEPTQLPFLMGQYLTDLFSGTYDQQYLMRRIRVGVVHQHIGISPDRFIAALSKLLSTLIGASSQVAESTGRSPHEVITTLAKICLFDFSLVLEVYAHADHHSIEHLAKHDSLTGLPNHNMLQETLKAYLKDCDENHPLAVMFIGLNSFKAVNETLGHDVGDIILQDVATRLLGMVPPRGIAARVGGDIFVMLAPLTDEKHAESLTGHVLSALSEPLSLEGFSVDVSATVGVVIANSSGISGAGLMSQAEMALYHAKHHQLPTTTYTAKMKRYSVGQLAIGTEMRRAIDNNELMLVFQPKVNVASGETVGVEALIRWIHPLRGFIQPCQFIPLAEKSALIHPVTDWVITAAMKRAVALHEKGYPLRMSVNLAAPNLQNYELPARIEELLKIWRLTPDYLIFEITESSLMVDPKRAHDTIRRMRDLGVKLSIDDFGTGYSSLAYLKDLPVDEVKIDQAFIRRLRQNQKDQRIVRAMIQLSHGLGLEVAAEGVEDEDTLQLLGFFGCDTAQGFYLSEPVTGDELERWLDKRGRR